jgi:RNA polymerase sigma-70 factor (ECF subfamily)
MVSSVRRICPAWLADDAEDLVQEAMLRIMRLEERDGGELQVTNAYLNKVAHSALVDEIRRRRRRREVAMSAEDGEHEVADGSVPAEPGLQQEIGDAIAACLAEQEESRRRALTLYLLGHSVPEAARLLAWKAKRTENLIYRGLATLRTCLARVGFALTGEGG